MNKLVILIACVALPWLACPAMAQQQEAVAALTDTLKAHAPKGWEVRVRWRDGVLLASITPWPYQDAFDLWYDTGKLVERMRALCPDQAQEVWGLIAPSQDIVLEPTVGGKSAVEARVSCRAGRAIPL